MDELYVTEWNSCMDEDLDEDFACKDHLEKDDQIKEWVEEVVHQAYNIGNVSLLENALEELCALVEVDFPKKESKFVKKEEVFFRKEELEQHSQIRDCVEEAVHQVYTTGCVPLLENALGDLCDLVDLVVPTNESKLAKKEKVLFNFEN